MSSTAFTKKQRGIVICYAKIHKPDRLGRSFGRRSYDRCPNQCCGSSCILLGCGSWNVVLRKWLWATSVMSFRIPAPRSSKSCGEERKKLILSAWVTASRPVPLFADVLGRGRMGRVQWSALHYCAHGAHMFKYPTGRECMGRDAHMEERYVAERDRVVAVIGGVVLRRSKMHVRAASRSGQNVRQWNGGSKFLTDFNLSKVQVPYKHSLRETAEWMYVGFHSFFFQQCFSAASLYSRTSFEPRLPWKIKFLWNFKQQFTYWVRKFNNFFINSCSIFLGKIILTLESLESLIWRTFWFRRWSALLQKRQACLQEGQFDLKTVQLGLRCSPSLAQKY